MFHPAQIHCNFGSKRNKTNQVVIIGIRKSGILPPCNSIGAKPTLNQNRNNSTFSLGIFAFFISSLKFHFLAPTSINNNQYDYRILIHAPSLFLMRIKSHYHRLRSIGRGDHAVAYIKIRTENRCCPLSRLQDVALKFFPMGLLLYKQESTTLTAHLSTKMILDNQESVCLIQDRSGNWRCS